MNCSQALKERFLEILQDQSIQDQSNCIGRFAPSPSGPLHLGNIRTALISWLFSRLMGGKWILRIDDLDHLRTRSGSIESIQKDLNCLGLYWDGPIIFQSQRKAIYDSALVLLKEFNKLYACSCSRRELAAFPTLKDQCFVYPGTCRRKKLPLKLSCESGHGLRLKVSSNFSNVCGDVLVKRTDGIISYHLASVVDEFALGITHVIRGDDLSNCLNYQLAIIDTFRQQPMDFLHVPLVFENSGNKMSKRSGSNGLEQFRKEGYKPTKLIGQLAYSLGLIPLNSEISALELLEEVSLEQLNLIAT